MENPQKSTIFTYIDTPYPQTSTIIKLCLKAWEINLPNQYELKIINNQNIENYFSEDTIKNLRKYENCPTFTNYIKALILNKYGGIFISPDTVMTQDFDAKEILLNTTESIIYYDQQIGIIDGFLASREKSKLTTNLIKTFIDPKLSPDGTKNKNTTINNIIKNLTLNELIKMDCENSGYIMEKEVFGVYSNYLYKNYYFTNTSKTDEFFKHTKGLTKLQNSITPDKYKQMSEKEFLKQDILLAHIFKELLK